MLGIPSLPIYLRCWSYANLLPIINSYSNNVEGFIDWVFNTIVVIKDEGLGKFAMILWNI